MTGRTEGYHAALASPSRRQVLDALVTSPTPLDAAAVAERLGLHVTTARLHLDQLTAAGLARRRAGSEHRRGRPRILYTPAGSARDEDAREQLIRVLAAALARQDDPVAGALRAGRSWAEGSAAPDPEHPVPGLVEALDRLGFDPEPDEPGSTIRLHACPFRDAAREQPEIVCSVHQGLIDRLLGSAGTRAQLLPFVEPQLCVVALASTPAVAG